MHLLSHGKAAKPPSGQRTPTILCLASLQEIQRTLKTLLRARNCPWEPSGWHFITDSGRTTDGKARQRRRVCVRVSEALFTETGWTAWLLLSGLWWDPKVHLHVSLLFSLDHKDTCPFPSPSVAAALEGVARKQAMVGPPCQKLLRKPTGSAHLEVVRAARHSTRRGYSATRLSPP